MEEKSITKSDLPNETIDLSQSPLVKVKEIPSKNPDELILELEGNSVDHSIVNALRRTVLRSIPIYGFHRSNIFIEVDKSRNMYNNDLIYNQIETLPIFDIPNVFDLENPKLYLSNEVLKRLFNNFVQETLDMDVAENQIGDADKKLFKIELAINFKNNTDVYHYVSTHDAVLKVDNKVSNSYKNRDPICILVLKPGEEIYLRAEANLGISTMNAIYEATTNAVHIELAPNKYRLIYETLGQLDKKMIFNKACTILIKQLDNLENYITKFLNEKGETETIDIELYGADHTLGNLIATALQKSKDVEAAGYVQLHPAIERIVISYKLTEKSKLSQLQVLIDVIKYCTKLFKKIQKAVPLD